jgi:hypothetical protein
MTSDHQLIRLAEHLCGSVDRQVDRAVALLWASDHLGLAPALTANDLRKLLEGLGLSKGSVNGSRLNRDLLQHSDIVRGSANGQLRIKPSSQTKLKAQYSDFIEIRSPNIDVGLTDVTTLPTKPPALRLIAQEANAAYALGLYDSAAVMVRRLIEGLLIQACEAQGCRKQIEDSDGELLSLGRIFGAILQTDLRLSRSTKKSLPIIKELGDKGAHHRFALLRKSDLELISPDLRATISELSHFCS